MKRAEFLLACLAPLSAGRERADIEISLSVYPYYSSVKNSKEYRSERPRRTNHGFPFPSWKESMLKPVPLLQRATARNIAQLRNGYAIVETVSLEQQGIPPQQRAKLGTTSLTVGDKLTESALGLTLR